MQRLLAPDGCPWDREQTLETLVPYLVEETYEVVDALADGDRRRSPRGAGRPAAADRLPVRAALHRRSVRHRRRRARHRHQAGAPPPARVRRRPRVEDADDVLSNWAKLKAEEKAEKGKHGALRRHPAQRPGAAARDARGREGERGRLRLARRRGTAREDRRGAGELDEARQSRRPRGDAARARRHAVRDREPGAQAGPRRRVRRSARRPIASGGASATSRPALAAQGRAVADAGADEQERLWQAAKRAEGLK